MTYDFWTNGENIDICKNQYDIFIHNIIAKKKCWNAILLVPRANTKRKKSKELKVYLSPA